MAKPFMEAGEQTGVVIDGRPGLNGDRGEQARLRRLGPGNHDAGKFELIVSMAPGTFPASAVIDRGELDALLDFAADSDLVTDARHRGAMAERDRVVAELRRYAEEGTAGFATGQNALQKIVNGAIEKIRTTGEESDRGNAG